MTERGTEVSRMGHRSIRSKTMTHRISIDVECRHRAEGHEFISICLGRGYSDYDDKYLHICNIDENGYVTIHSDFLERVEEHNRRIRESK
jgi:hypothetical protein